MNHQDMNRILNGIYNICTAIEMYIDELNNHHDDFEVRMNDDDEIDVLYLEDIEAEIDFMEELYDDLFDKTSEIEEFYKLI